MENRLLINEYIEDHQLSWAPSTLKSEASRLNSLKDLLLPQDSLKMWSHLERVQKPYARVTTWIRIVHFVDWLLKNNHITGINEYDSFRTKNRRLFKNCYERRVPSISYHEASNLIGSMDRSDVREVAKRMLASGMRASEALQNTSGIVSGKGKKQRQVYSAPVSKFGQLSYQNLYRRLKKETGLTPHMLRKMCMTRLVELGANPFELCKIAGWNSLETARSYIAVNDDKIKQLMEKL